MTSLGRYRKFSKWAMLTMVVALILSFAALWNTLLTAPVRHEGWVIVFLILVFIPGSLLFYIAHKTSDSASFEMEKMKAYESGKAEILKELEKRNQEENNEQKDEQEDIDKTVHQLLAGTKTTLDQKACHKLLSNLGKNMGFVQGIFYIKNHQDEQYHAAGEFALTGQKPAPFIKGDGLAGQVAESKSPMILYDIPEHYFDIASGLGSAKPRFLILVPVLFENECLGVIELAAFRKPDGTAIKTLQRLSDELGIKINTTFVA
jgi:hypothetical protein